MSSLFVFFEFLVRAAVGLFAIWWAVTLTMTILDIKEDVRAIKKHLGTKD